MFKKLRQLLEMIRFSHTIFALPFAMLAAVIAWTTPVGEGQIVSFRWQDLLGILICMVTARSAAMAFNRLVDRDIDAGNPRTKLRHIPAGLLSVPSVALFTVICGAGFVIATLLFLPNWLPFYLAVPVLLVLLFYSYTKRITSLAHYWLGFSLMLAPIAVWIALRGEIVITNPWDLTPAIMLGLSVFFWVAGFDIIYSCQDYEFDCESKLKSVPTRFGIQGALRIAAASHLVMLVVLALLPTVSAYAGVPTELGWLYYATVLAVAGLLIYEHSLVKPDDLTRVNIAFFQVNSVVSFGLFLAGSIDSIVLN
ncbi:MAG: UbiA-like polyprenyltransferase [Pirellulaceae bacterium]|nr:UbiA-like polyprenyltransferase [Pirellulaceae bacterium]